MKTDRQETRPADTQKDIWPHRQTGGGGWLPPVTLSLVLRILLLCGFFETNLMAPKKSNVLRILHGHESVFARL